MDLKQRVEQFLDQVRGGLQADGGDVKLVEVTDEGVVKVSLVGACSGCPMASMTLKNGIERFLMSNIPEVKRVESV